MYPLVSVCLGVVFVVRFKLMIDNLAITLRTEPNTKMMDELIPASYVHILHQLIANVKLYREIEVFPVLKYQHFQ